jgi:hypothetical protein
MSHDTASQLWALLTKQLNAEETPFTCVSSGNRATAFNLISSERDRDRCISEYTFLFCHWAWFWSFVACLRSSKWFEKTILFILKIFHNNFCSHNNYFSIRSPKLCRYVSDRHLRTVMHTLIYVVENVQNLNNSFDIMDIIGITHILRIV